MVDSKNIEPFTYRKKTTEIAFEMGSRVGRLEAMPRDPGDGGNPAVAVVDEFHEAKDMSLLETMKSGQAQRREPLNMIITSPGVNKEVPCYSVLRKNSVDILNGLVEDDRFLPIIFELDSDEEWDDIDKLMKSNPMMYVTDTLRPYLESRIKEAKNQGGFVETSVKIKNSGIWTDVADVWIQDEILRKNSFGVPDDILEGRQCFAGLDLAKKEDLNAFALFFPDVPVMVNGKEELKHVVKMMYWIPEDKVRDNRDRIDYSRHVQNGWMTQQSGNVADHRLVSRDIIEEIKKYDVRSFGYDARYSYGAIIPDLVGAGYEEVLAPVGQGFELSPAVVWANEAIRRHEFDLRDNPVLLWNFANTVMKMGHHGDMYPSKAESNNRIDGISALLTAVTEYLHIGVTKESYYGFAVLN
jgi:phage terminase large subunit-like protein